MSNNTNPKNFNKNQNNNKSGNTGNTGSTTTTSSTTNELIVAIDNARKTGSPVKQLRKQKHDPNNFYFTLEDGKQFGPVAVTGDEASARLLVRHTHHVPPLTWGRRVPPTTDMWNSNSVVAWLLRSAGVPDVAAFSPPAGGRAPGWAAGLAVEPLS